MMSAAVQARGTSSVVMSALGMTREERLGLAISIAAHAALVAFLVLRPAASEVVTPPKRVEVTLSDTVGLTSAAPVPDSQARADVAPVLGEAAPIHDESFRPMPLPEPVRVAPQMPSRPQPRPAPRSVSEPVPWPSASPQPRRADKPAPARQSARKAAKQPDRAGGSRVGKDFLSGLSGAQAQQGSGTPAAITGAVRSALTAAVSRQLKPNWHAPSGVDIDKLAVTVEWELNPDGTLAGNPTVVGGVTGVNASNRAQVDLYREQALRTVRITHFNLPGEYYAAWKRMRFTFDWKLNQ